MELFDRGEISLEAMRGEIRILEKDKPDEEDYRHLVPVEPPGQGVRLARTDRRRPATARRRAAMPEYDPAIDLHRPRAGRADQGSCRPETRATEMATASSTKARCPWADATTLLDGHPNRTAQERPTVRVSAFSRRLADATSLGIPVTPLSGGRWSQAGTD